MPPKPSRSEPVPAEEAVRPEAEVPGAIKKSARSSRRKVTVEVYNAFISQIDIASIRLAGATIVAAAAPERRRILPKTEIRGARFTNGDATVIVTHELAFTGTYEGEAEPAVTVQADFEVRYSSPERMSREIFAEFQKRNLPYNTWPYFREFVHAALARAGWPLFVLPVYKGVGPQIAVVQRAEGSPGT